MLRPFSMRGRNDPGRSLVQIPLPDIGVSGIEALEPVAVSRLASLQRLASVQLADVHSRCHFYKTRVALESRNAVTLTTRDGSKSFPQDFFVPNRGTAATWDSFQHELFNSGMVCASECCSRHARLCREFSSRIYPDYERMFVLINP